MIHEIAHSSETFNLFWEGRKLYEVIWSGPNAIVPKYKDWDVVVIQEWSSKKPKQSGREIHANITYVTDLSRSAGCIVFQIKPYKFVDVPSKRSRRNK